MANGSDADASGGTPQRRREYLRRALEVAAMTPHETAPPGVVAFASYDGVVTVWSVAAALPWRRRSSWGVRRLLPCVVALS